MEYFKLEKYADVEVGQILSRATDDSATDSNKLTVLMPKAINDGFISKEELKVTYQTNEILSNKFTRKGDVIIKLSSPYDAAYIDKEHEGYLIPSFLAAVRIANRERIDARYLAALFNTQFTRNQLQALQTGAKRPMIRVSELRTMDIPDAGLYEMERIGEEYALSCKKRKLLMEMIEIERGIMESTVLISATEGKR